MRATPAAIYRAWTERVDSWFAAAGTPAMRAAVGEPFYFAVEHEGAHHPHYGRFLALDPGRRIELAWVTGRGGTDGAETIIRIDLMPGDVGTRLTLSQTGFYTESAAAAAQGAWPHVLAHLDARLTEDSSSHLRGGAMSSSDVVRASFAAYRAQDHEAAAGLLADTFTFTSPQDDHIDKATYLERCFPTADRFTRHEILELVEPSRDTVLVLYEYQLATGDWYRNTEYLTARDGQLTETQVFFGGRVHRLRPD